MRQERKAPRLRNILLPLIMTAVSFVLFLVVYIFLTTRFVNERYLENLIFAVPVLCFGVIAFLTATGRIKGDMSPRPCWAERRFC